MFRNVRSKPEQQQRKIKIIYTASSAGVLCGTGLFFKDVAYITEKDKYLWYDIARLRKEILIYEEICM